jgi:hypothetical protein
MALIMTPIHFINKYGWLWTLISGVFVAGMLGAGILHGESQSATNGDDIVQLKIGQATMNQKIDDLSEDVHSISSYLGVKK